VTEENVFLVAAAIVPGKSLDLNEGIRFLTGKGKISLPFRKKAEAAPAAPPAAAPAPAESPAVAWRGPVTTECIVVEGATTRRFQITIAPPSGAEGLAPSSVTPASVAPPGGGRMPVYSPFEGKVQLVEIRVRVGDAVREGQVVAAVEAMKAKHDVRCLLGQGRDHRRRDRHGRGGRPAHPHHRGLGPCRFSRRSSTNRASRA